jgi:hypothetical protein
VNVQHEVNAMNAISTGFQPLSPKDFAAIGLHHVAYVRTVDVQGATGYGVFAADGTPLTVLPGRDVAMAAIRQNDMEPVSVH